MPYTPGTITGTYQLPDGTPASGRVEVIPSADVIRDTAGNVLISGRVKPTLDAQGSFSVDVPGFDSEVDPTGVTYTVVAKLNHTRLPAVTGVRVDAGQTVDMADVTPVDPEAPVYATQVTRAEFDSLTALVGAGGGGGDPAVAADVTFLMESLAAFWPTTTTPEG